MLEKLAIILNSITGISEEEITGESLLMDDLELSSIEVFAFLGEVESAFSIKFSSDDIDGFESVQDVIDFLLKRE